MQEVSTNSALAITRKNMRDYLRSHDARYVTDDAVFIDKSTGHCFEGREEVARMLQFFYKNAFDAHTETTRLFVSEEYAFAEGLFMGKHIGEFEGIQPTRKLVTVPLAVSFMLEDGLIREAHIYMMRDVLLRQLVG
jgi:hypothetical protein